MSIKKTTKKIATEITDKNSIENKYKKKSQLEHIKELPDTYIGSVEMSEIETYVYDEESNKILKKTINIVPGLYKIFDEILVNAIDQYTRLNKTSSIKVTQIKVDIDAKENMISVYNNGEGIDVAIHNEYSIYVPEMIFGNLLTSTNYDKDEKKITGGKNGYGAKLTNIFSKKFIIETVDSKRQLLYIQTFKNNMDEKEDPQINIYKGQPYTKITFYPDLERFGMKELDEDIVQLIKKRVYDCTATTGPEVIVYFNGKKLEYKSFEKYADLYMGEKSETPRVYEEVDDRWSIIVSASNDDRFEQVSFVNGVCTYKGGKHVDYVAKLISRKLQNYVKTKGIKRKKITIKQNIIQDNMMIILRSVIENPSFDSQTKEYLTTNPDKFGSIFDVSDKFIEKVAKTGILEKALKYSEYKDSTEILSKTDGKKQTTLRGIPKLDDANWAGTKKSAQCTLILTEGDSAKAFAIAGLEIIGRDKYGVFPLKGKLLNVRDAEATKVSENTEISNLVKILGLQYGKEYDNENLSDLRYGSLMILTDQDVDGSHIKGLIMNWIENFWPSLAEVDGFLTSMRTPIVKASKGKQIKTFYSLSAFEYWKITESNLQQWFIKYYKGLGTSTSAEAKEYFKDLIKNQLIYQYNGEEDDKDIIRLAFEKDRSDDRKDWLMQYDRNKILDTTAKIIPIKDFFHKDFIHFSNYDCERSIPNMIDGLKVSQRKVLYGSLKKNIVSSEIKVAQLSGYISEHSAYHHGEQSLNETIIGMAQNFVGSNNINLLEPIGNFGTRLQGGKDAASPRYIFTKLSKLTKAIYHPEDYPLLEYRDDDGSTIEPYYYVPVIPMILVNGATGIGTGFSTSLPCFNPKDIIYNLKELIKGNDPKEMKPWYKGFEGDIYSENGKYFSKGIYKLDENKNTIQISELPIGYWTDKFKEDLDKMLVGNTTEKSGTKKNILSSFKNDSTENKVNFTLKFTEDNFDDLIEDMPQLIKKFGLIDSKNTSMSNIHFYNESGSIQKFENPIEILKIFYDIRLNYYVKRREYNLQKLKEELDIIRSKVEFIQRFVSGELKILNIDEEKIIEQLNKINEDSDITIFVKVEDSYDYLITMQIRSLTKKRIEELNNLQEKKEAEYKALQKKTSKDLWKIDLDIIDKLL